MSDTYLDSSFLLKLYLKEPDSHIVDGLLKGIQGTTLVTLLTDVEVVSSAHRRLPVPDGSLAARSYLANRASGMFGELLMDEKVFAQAVRIADLYAKPYKLKSLDILHLATATSHGVSAIASLDKNLRAAAVALGPAVLPA